MSWAPNSPRPKIVAVMGPAKTSIPTAAGDASTQGEPQCPVQGVCAKRSFDACAWCCERPGRITVASAMLKTPSGNSISRSAKYSQAMLPVTRNDAIKRVEQQTDLRHRRPDDARHHQLADTPHAFQRGPPFRPRQQPEPRDRGQLKTTCNRPATNTPADITRPGLSLPTASHAVKRIITTFITLCVAAGMAKRPKLLSTPLQRAVSEMNSTYGKVRRSIATA